MGLVGYTTDINSESYTPTWKYTVYMGSGVLALGFVLLIAYRCFCMKKKVYKEV